MVKFIKWIVLFTSLLLIFSCKLSISTFLAPESANTGSIISVIIEGVAEDLNGYEASSHGLVLELPVGWQVLSAKYGSSGVLSEDTSKESFYTATNDSNYVWVGTASGSSSENIELTVKILTGNFSGNPGDTQLFTIKSAAGALRDNSWETDDPSGIFNFSNITSDKYVEKITVTKVVDDIPPAALTKDELKAENAHNGFEINLNWTAYDESAQEDVISYRIYKSTSNFTSVNNMTPIDEVSSEIKNYTVGGLIEGQVYYFAVTAIDEVPNENDNVSTVSITPEEDYGSISGVVFENNTSPVVPISNMKVEAHNIETYTQYSTYTQGDGSYTITGILPGNYTVKVETNGTEFVSEYYDDVTYEDLATPISVSEKAEINNIDFGLAIGGKIGGIVFENNTSPQITIPNIDIEARNLVTNITFHSETLSDGSYIITNLPAGNYRVHVDAYGTKYLDEYYNDVNEKELSTPVDVKHNILTPNINFGLDVGGIISGTITRKVDSNSVSGVDVKVYYSETDDYYSSRYNIDGAYEFNRLPAGNYHVCVNAYGTNYRDKCYQNANGLNGASSVQVSLNSMIDNIDIELDIELKGKVKTNITGKTTPLVDASVSLIQNGSTLMSTNTNLDGEYSFINPTFGTYDILVKMDNFKNNTLTNLFFSESGDTETPIIDMNDLSVSYIPGDTNEDGIINIIDIIMNMQLIVGM